MHMFRGGDNQECKLDHKELKGNHYSSGEQGYPHCAVQNTPHTFFTPSESLGSKAARPNSQETEVPPFPLKEL